jgi:hypothetical protein
MKKLVLLVAFVLVVINSVSNAGTTVITSHNVKIAKVLGE